MTVQTFGIVVVLLSLNISYLVVLSKYSKSSEFESYDDRFPNREQQFMWRVLPTVISILNFGALVSVGFLNPSRMFFALVAVMIAGRPFIGVIVWIKSTRSMWKSFILKNHIPSAMITMVLLLTLDYLVLSRFAGPLFG